MASELETIKAEIATARKEVTEASTVSDQARQVAADAADYYAMMGLEGIYNELRVVAEKLETAVAQHNTAGDSVDAAATVLQNVTDKTKIPDAVKQLGEAVEKLEGATVAIQTATGEANDALSHAQGVEHEDTMAHASNAVNVASQAHTVIETAKTKDNEYKNKINPSGK